MFFLLFLGVLLPPPFLPPPLAAAQGIRTLDGPGDDHCFEVTSDADGAVYVVGVITGPTPLGDLTLKPAGAADGFVAKFAPDGTPAWCRTIGGAGNDDAKSICLGPNGSIVVSGQFQDEAEFHPKTPEARLATEDGQRNQYLLKLDAAGEFVWVRDLGPRNRILLDKVSDNAATCVRVDDSGRIYTVSMIRGKADMDPGSESAILDSGDATRGVLARYSADGEHEWSLLLGERDQTIDVQWGLAVEGSKVFVGGTRWEPAQRAGGSRSKGSMYLGAYTIKGKRSWTRALPFEMQSAPSGARVEGGARISHLGTSKGSVLAMGTVIGVVDFEPARKLRGDTLGARVDHIQGFVLSCDKNGDLKRVFGVAHSAGNLSNNTFAVTEKGEIVVASVAGKGRLESALTVSAFTAKGKRRWQRSWPWSREGRVAPLSMTATPDGGSVWVGSLSGRLKAGKKKSVELEASTRDGLIVRQDKKGRIRKE